MERKGETAKGRRMSPAHPVGPQPALSEVEGSPVEGSLPNVSRPPSAISALRLHPSSPLFRSPFHACAPLAWFTRRLSGGLHAPRSFPSPLSALFLSPRVWPNADRRLLIAVSCRSLAECRPANAESRHLPHFCLLNSGCLALPTFAHYSTTKKEVATFDFHGILSP